MKRLYRIYLLSGFILIQNIYSQDLIQKAQDILSKSQDKICLNTVFKELNLVGNFGPWVDVAFSNLCISKPNLETLKDGIQFKGDTTFKGINATGSIKIFPDSNYTATITINAPGAIKLGDLASPFSVIDQIATFNNLKIINSSKTDKVPIIENLTPIIGTIISGQIQVKGFLENFLSPLGLSIIDIKIFIPQEATKLSDIKYEFHPIMGAEGICPVKALGALKLSFAQPLIDKLQGICFSPEALRGEIKKEDVEKLGQEALKHIGPTKFGSGIGLVFDEKNNPIFYISGPLSGGGKEAMIKVKKEKNGGFIFTIGLRADTGFSLGDVNPALKIFDSIAVVIDPLVIFTNGSNESIFDIDFDKNKINPKQAGAISGLQKGLTIGGSIEPKGFLKDITDPLFTSVRTLTTIPLNAKSSKDIKVRITPVIPKKGICPFAVVEKLEPLLKKMGLDGLLDPSSDQAKLIIPVLEKLCIHTNIGLIIDDDLNMTFYVNNREVTAIPKPPVITLPSGETVEVEQPMEVPEF